MPRRVVREDCALSPGISFARQPGTIFERGMPVRLDELVVPGRCANLHPTQKNQAKESTRVRVRRYKHALTLGALTPVDCLLLHLYVAKWLYK